MQDSSSSTRDTHRGVRSIEKLLLLGLLALLLPREILLIVLADIDTAQVDFGAGGDDVSGIDTAERDTIDLEGTGDKEDAVGEGLEVDDALSTETAGEDDEDCAGLEGLTQGGGLH